MYSKYLQKVKPEIYGRIGRQDFVEEEGEQLEKIEQGAATAATE